MARFEDFLSHLLLLEGGWSDHPKDPGGATNMGITKRTFDAVARPLLGIEPTLDNLRRLTREQASLIYRRIYWDKLGVEELRDEDQVLAEIYADFFVNAGANAVILMQRCLNAMNAAASPLSEDGIPGPSTRHALLASDPKELYRRYREGRIRYYDDLVRRRPELQCFLKGWHSRVETFPQP
jgi:lysozyme family protein